jgi:hypothetical protein
VTVRERLERWKAWWRAQPKGPTGAEREAADAERQRQLGAAFEDEVLKHIAYKGVYVPGEPADDVPTPPRGLVDGQQWGGGDGPRHGWIRW